MSNTFSVHSLSPNYFQGTKKLLEFTLIYFLFSTNFPSLLPIEIYQVPANLLLMNFPTNRYNDVLNLVMYDILISFQIDGKKIILETLEMFQKQGLNPRFSIILSLKVRDF